MGGLIYGAACGIVNYFNYYLSLEWEHLPHTHHVSAAGRWKRILSFLSLIKRLSNSTSLQGIHPCKRSPSRSPLLLVLTLRIGSMSWAECPGTVWILPVSLLRKQELRGWIYTTGRVEVESWARLTHRLFSCPPGWFAYSPWVSLRMKGMFMRESTFKATCKTSS